MIRFEWDSAKEQANRRKHGISFEIARQVFGDPAPSLNRIALRAAKFVGKR